MVVFRLAKTALSSTSLLPFIRMGIVDFDHVDQGSQIGLAADPPPSTPAR
jgi:hypothetical protein